jgi:hypothetical protein
MKKSKIKTVLAIIGIAVLLFTAVLTMTAGIVNAKPTATRKLPAEQIPADGSFRVEIEVSDYGTFGKISETLPEGFTYMTSSISGVYDGPTCTIDFTLSNENFFTYTVALHYHDIKEGTYTFSGKLLDEEGDIYDIGGDTEIVVEEAEEEEMEPSTTRILPEEPVVAGEHFTVEIDVLHYGYFGKIVETLPEGFIFEDYSGLKPESVEVEDDTVEFSLGGEPSFTYTVIAPDDEGTYTFDGILMDEEKDEYDIRGDTEVVVGEGEGAGADKVIIGAPNITSWKPVEATVNNAEGESRTFNISVNQPVDISWQINGTEVQTNESVTEAVYTNTSAVIGTWNVSAIATNATMGLSDTHTWIWCVTLTLTATPTPAVDIISTSTPSPSLAPTPTPAVNVTSTSTPSPSLAPTPISKPSPTPTPSTPGFETVFTFASIFAVTYLILHGKKCTKSQK